MNMQSFDQIWKLICERFQKDSRYSDQEYTLWIETIRPIGIQGKEIYIEVPSEFQKSIIEGRYLGLLEEYMMEILGFDFPIVVTLPSMKEEEKKSDAPLHEEYTFETFIVGDSNRFAYAACQAVAASEDKKYNPLFIHGKSGLGKTHLLFAIQNKIKTLRPDAKILYVSCEQFGNDFIKAIGDRKMHEFKSKYRQVDVLLIDDVQFLATRERVQEEFFHTFNELYQLGKQIVLTSDRSPREIATLEDRIRTRFESGLITDIQIPDFETRVAIIHKKAAGEDLTLSDEVAEMLATKLKNSIRQIEGAVTKLAALNQLEGKKPTAAAVQLLINEMVSQNQPVETLVDRIVQQVSETFNVKEEDICSKRKTAELSLPRHVCFYLIKEMTTWTMKEIGKYFGGKDHTTVLYGINRIAQMKDEDSSFNDILEGIKKNVSVE